MYATQDLRDEHEGIKITLAVLGRLAGDAEAGRPVDAGDAADLVDFLKTFADKCHHGKEEDLLFPALEAAGIPRVGGPVGAMLDEHVQGREFIARMDRALPGLTSDDPTSPTAFAEAARGYAQLLTQHIEKENDVLFHMAEARLSEEEHTRLKQEFDRLEEERMGPGVHERYHAMLDRLREKYL